MKQHSVPENIMDVQFKLFGSLTAKQFGYIIGGAGVALGLFFVFKSLEATFLGWIFAALSVVLGLSLALIRINDQPFEVWLGNFLAAMFSSQKRVWKKTKKEVPHLSNDKVPVQTQATVQPQAAIASNTVQQAPAVQEEKPSIPKHPFKDISTPGKSQQQPVQQQTKNQAGLQNDQQTQTQTQTQPNFQQTGKSFAYQSRSESQNNLTGPSDGEKGKLQNDQINSVAGESVSGSTYNIPGSAQGYVKVSNNQMPNRPLSISPTNRTQQNQTQQDQPNDDKQDQQYNQTAGINEVLKQNFLTVSGKVVNKSTKATEKEVTDKKSDHTGVEDKQSDLYLKEEKENQTQQPSLSQVSKAAKYEDVVPDKQQLRQIAAQQDESRDIPDENVLKEENSALREKVATYLEENSKLENQISEIKESNRQLKQQNEQINNQLASMRTQIEEMSKKSNESEQTQAEQTQPTSSPPSQNQQQVPEQQKAQLQPQLEDGKLSKENSGSFTPSIYDGPSLSKKPNVVSGIVKTKEGKLLPGVTVIIKDPSKRPPRPIRAMTTNSLGQFITVSEIEQKGTYIIELSKSAYEFGRYEIEITGKILPTYEFVAF